MRDLVPRPTLSTRPQKTATGSADTRALMVDEGAGTGNPEIFSIGDEDDEEWVDFGVVELEEAKQRKKDPGSFSVICCWKKCLMGPKEKSSSPKIANGVNFMMLAFNVLTLSYTMRDEWIWLTSLNIGIGMISSMLMWCVMCSDPGIINRNQDTEKLPFFKEQEKNLMSSGEYEMNFRDRYLSISSFENNAITEWQSEEMQNIPYDEASDKSRIFKESRFYQYRDCPTCTI